MPDETQDDAPRRAPADSGPGEPAPGLDTQDANAREPRPSSEADIDDSRETTGAPSFLTPDVATPAVWSATAHVAGDAGLPGGPRLVVWLVLLLAFGAASLLFNWQEAAFLVALAGLFVAAQAADLYPAQRYLYWALTWIVPAAGVAAFSAFTFMILQGEPAPMQIPIAALSVTGALASLLVAFRPFSNPLTRILFKGEEPTHALRLSARLVIMGLLLALPGWYAFKDEFESLLQNSQSMFDAIGTGLPGYVLLALASVGFMVRRDFKGTMQRLGIRPLRGADWLAIPLGVAALFALNIGLESVQRNFFPGAWAADQHVTQLIAGGLAPVQILMLGLSAGIGEEITLRGALQPKLGILLTSLLFASLHVQYSWFGMGVIFVFGIVLGVIRNRTSTSVAMAIHTVYDVIAVIATIQAQV